MKLFFLLERALVFHGGIVVSLTYAAYRYWAFIEAEISFLEIVILS